MVGTGGKRRAKTAQKEARWRAKMGSCWLGGGGLKRVQELRAASEAGRGGTRPAQGPSTLEWNGARAGHQGRQPGNLASTLRFLDPRQTVNIRAHGLRSFHVAINAVGAERDGCTSHQRERIMLLVMIQVRKRRRDCLQSVAWVVL
ncbi:hypothetical protein LIA77_03533 [Sarocladium implicatum]|nr:hypothetical protein LIA77_03533 [Sarocladium implicatum]